MLLLIFTHYAMFHRKGKKSHIETVIATLRTATLKSQFR